MEIQAKRSYVTKLVCGGAKIRHILGKNIHVKKQIVLIAKWVLEAVSTVGIH